MLKISNIESGEHAVTLRLEGSVIGPWVAELRQSCEAVLLTGRGLRLHLADVEFMDARGVALLTSLRSRGVSLVQCPPFAAEQLKTTGKC
jgi:anti-anti-sigma regulatory factor